MAVCASYRCSRHVYQACLSHAQQCLCLREPVRAALASYPIGAPAMFVSHVSAMPLSACELVVAVCASYRCSRHVYQACLRHAQQCLCLREPVRAALASYPIGAPAMFVSHVSAMPLSACELVVAVCASYRCSRHVYQACLRHAQQCLCLREPVRAALASYSIGAPAMFVSHVSAMPLHMRARGGRVCIVSVLPACL